MDTAFGGFGGMSSTTASSTKTTTPTTTAQEIDESTPWVAASDGDLPLLQKSLQTLTLPHTCADSNGLTPIHSAASYGHIEVVRWILRRDAEVVVGSEGGSSSDSTSAVNAKDMDGDTPLHHCDDVRAARVLVEEGGADYTLTNDQGETAYQVKERELAEGAEEGEEEDSDDDEMQNLVKLVTYLRALVNGDNLQGGEEAMET